MMEEKRPGPKPKRLYLRLVRQATDGEGPSPPPERAVRQFTENLERVGRLVARGRLTEPAGDLLLFRAYDLAEARRILRADPYREADAGRYELFAWDARTTGSGVNLEPAPARGAGRLTALQRVAVVVRDRARATAWYEEVLGLKVREDDPATGYVELSLSGGSAGLSLVAPRREWGEPYYSETAARIGKATGIAFQTDSVRALELRLVHAGARITEPYRRMPWGGSTVRFCDPDGNEFLAFEHPPPGAGARAEAPAEPPLREQAPPGRPKVRKRRTS